jgi:DNA-binding PucR family transcriptional regulator
MASTDAGMRSSMGGAVHTVLGDLAQAFEDRIANVARETAERSRLEVEGWDEIDSPEVWEMIRELTRRSRQCQADHLRRGLELPVTCPQPDREAAVLAVRAGAALTASIKSFRIGHAVAWSAWLDALQELQLDPEARMTLLREMSSFVIAYDGRVTDLFTRAFTDAEREQKLRGRSELELVREVLAGFRTDFPAALEYELDDEHVAIIAWGERIEYNLLRLTGRVERRVLLLQISDDSWWGWVAHPGGIGTATLRALRGFAPTGACRLAIGSPGEGVQGFCRSHRQAGEAHSVALRTERAVTAYADVALEALGLRDERAAREFVAEQLGALASGDGRESELRETLRRYFASAQNAASAAAALGVHEQTVARRIRTIEERLGRRVNDKRPELELALRLEELLA